jgi:predicted ATPase
MRLLDQPERSVLVCAAAIGRRFRLAVLSATTALDEERVRLILEKARGLQFVVRECTADDWYAFRHALIRDVAYQEFVAMHLRSAHRRIARALERCAGDDTTLLDDLAYHWWAARDPLRCRRYNERAGDEAVAAFASDEARAYYVRALEFTAPECAPYRRLSTKVAALGGEARFQGGESPERQSAGHGDCSTRTVPPVRWTPK